ncbi:MAG: CBS domain-containing protein, partial [Flavobacteriales bacterium]|nr:CBS domain-containing protein [Flavobacteriales bacterium]
IISKPKSRKIEVTLKLNKQNTTAIIKDFERREYNISASYKNEESNYDVQERYESLMRFLNP